MSKAILKAKELIKTGLPKYLKVIEEARAKKINESDTCFIVNDMLGLLGYDKFFDVTTEYKVRGQFVDYAVKVKGKILFFIEVKSIDTDLNENHLYQAASYAANEGVEWVILTNGAVWQVYHLVFSKPIDRRAVFSLDLLNKDLKAIKKMELLYHLSKEGFAEQSLHKFMTQKMALSGANVAGILLSPTVLEKIRREIKLKTGFPVSAEEVKTILQEDVFKDSLKGEAVTIKAKPAAKKKAVPNAVKPAAKLESAPEAVKA